MAPRSIPRWPRQRAVKKDGTARAFRKPRVLEKTEQAHGVQLLRSIGAKVYVLGTRRSRGKSCPKCGTFVPEDQGTHQTPGISDVFAILPPRAYGRRRALWWEAKASDGRMSPDQAEFKELCGETDLEHVVGTLDALIAGLVGLGYVKAEQFPHYRQPTAKQERTNPT